MKQPGKAERSRSWQVPVETGFGFFLSLSIFLLMDQTGIGCCVFPRRCCTSWGT